MIEPSCSRRSPSDAARPNRHPIPVILIVSNGRTMARPNLRSEFSKTRRHKVAPTSLGQRWLQLPTYQALILRFSLRLKDGSFERIAARWVRFFGCRDGGDGALVTSLFGDSIYIDST